MLKIRRSWDRLIFNMGIAILVRRHFYIETAPRCRVATNLARLPLRMKKFYFWLRFHGILFLRVQLMMIRHWFKQWLGAEWATSHYLNQCWPRFTVPYMWYGGGWINEPSIIENGQHFYNIFICSLISWTKIMIIWFEYHWSLSLRLTVCQHWFR